MQNPMSPTFGPGSQPGEEDGTTLDYMQMPSGMMIFAAPDLPEADEMKGLEPAMGALEQLLGLLGDYREGRDGSRIELGGLNRRSLDFISQVLGEGEVSLIAGAGTQAQEAVLAGVWRIRETSDDGVLVRDYVEVGRFPENVLKTAFLGARTAIAIPDAFGPNIFNAPPLLPEINEQIAKAERPGGVHVINLSLLPHTEEDLVFLNETLGRGSVTVLSRGYGNCRITATATRDVWWVQFYNSQDTMILNTIEITDIPEVACASAEDIADSAERLDEILEVYR